MAEGRTIWWAKDALWHDREAVVILGSEFGPAAPLVLDVLSCQAKLENAGGHFKTGYASLTRKAFVGDEEIARQIVARAVEIGALDDFEEDRLTFCARLSGWKADQDLASSAERQRRYRERLRDQGVATGAPGSIRKRVMDRDGNQCLRCGAVEDLVIDHVIPKSKGGPSTEDNLQTLCSPCNQEKGTSDTDYRPEVAAEHASPVTGVTSPVTPRDLKGQDSTEEVKSSLRSDSAELRSAIVECFAYWQERCGHPQATLTDDRRRKLTDRLKERARLHGGMPRAIRDVRQAIDGAARAPYVDPDTGKRFDDLELICRKGSKLEDFMGRANAQVVRLAPTASVSRTSDLIRKLNESEASA